jgi:GT2 family glycosyltransferase
MHLVEEWLVRKKDRFSRIQLIKSNKNTGTSANCNRGCSAAQAEWIKLFGGDDILLENCIQNYADYINANKDDMFLFSKIELFGDMDRITSGNMIEYWERAYEVFDTHPKAEDQKAFLINERNFAPSPSCFFNKTEWEEIGRFD